MKLYLFVTAVILAFSVADGQSSFALSGSGPSSTFSVASPSSSASANTGSVWTILSLDDGQRGNLCQRQESYCATQCGGPGGVGTNFCNITTMAWNCKCLANNSASNASNATYLNPVPLAECNGKFVSCQAACIPDANRSNCVQACTIKWACGTANSPPSYLETPSVTDQPSYNGPPPAPANTTTQTNSTAPVNPTKANSGQQMDMRHEVVVLLLPFVLLTLAQV